MSIEAAAAVVQQQTQYKRHQGAVATLNDVGEGEGGAGGQREAMLICSSTGGAANAWLTS